MSESHTSVTQSVQESLRTTPYACTNLKLLSGGSSNFLYHGTLIKRLPDGTTDVIIKHTEPHLFSNKDFILTPTRTYYESKILTYLSAFPAQSTPNDNISISTPVLLYYDPATHTQVHTHHPSLDCTNLKSYILKHHNDILSSAASAIGHSLGNWLKNFHTWANAPAQVELRKIMEGNEAMKRLKLAINYTNLVTMVDQFPKILGASKAVFEKVEKDMLGWMDSGEEGTRVLIHGDFWCGNVLLPDSPLPVSISTPTPIYITDHELSHLSTPVFDLGQMCAELYMLTYFKGITAGKQIFIAFLEGYGPIEEDLRWKVMIYIGCHLAGWGPKVAGWGTPEQVEGCIELGRDLVVNGWEKNREWCAREGWTFLIED